MAPSASDRTALLEVLLRRSLRFGNFTLASGATSSFYVDVRRTSLDAGGARLIGRLICDAYAQELADGRIAAVGGLTLGADPIVVSALLEAGARGHALDAFLVRKAPKEHGTGNRIEISGDKIIRTPKSIEILSGGTVSSYGDNVLSTGGDAPTIIPKG